MKLFDDEDNGGSSAEDISKIEINQDFARKYEHNKKREDLMRLDELKKQGRAGIENDDVSSSSDESDLGEITNPKKVSKFFDALIKVKNQDPALRRKEIKLFDDEENEQEESGLEKRGKKEPKPMYVKDVTAAHLLEEGPEFDDTEEVKSYAKEQESLRRGVVAETQKAMSEVADDGDLFKPKEHETLKDDDDDMMEVGEKLNEYFGKDGNLDENGIFLKNYFRNKMWAGDDKGVKVEGEDSFELSDDEVAVEDQEDYERNFNFRHTEISEDRVLGHPRKVKESVRKETNVRKEQRKRKAEREAQAEKERKEELKRLKNLKKKEMREKLTKIKETAGVERDWVCPLDEDDLEGEFDPEEHDRKMKDAFNDEYYGAEDVDPEFGSDADEDGEIEKPDFGKEDELLGLGKGWDEVSGSKDGFLAAREKFLERKEENDGEEKEEEEEEGNEDVVKEGKRKKKRKMSKMEKELLDKELEEYYKLDYEDTIGDLKTRFKYRGVASKRYGLSTEEILRLDDKELNQVVSLKKIATYREKEWKVDRNKVLEQKQKIKSLLKGERSYDQRNDDNRKLEIEDNKAEDEEIKGKESGLSRKKRRKIQEAELKIPNSRLAAYGKIPSKSKSKKKN